MIGQREQVLKEVHKYADFCTKIQNNLANGSSTIEAMKELNYQIGAKNHNSGWFFVKWQKLRNVINTHKVIWSVMAFILSAMLAYLMELVTATVDQNFHIFIPLVIVVFILIIGWKPVTVPFIKLRDKEKTSKYLALEDRLSENNRELNKLICTYEAFVNNALIAGFVTKPADIKGPTIESDGAFTYPFISAQLKTLNGYLQKHQAETIHEASMLYSQQLAYESQIENGSLVVMNTVETANYAKSSGGVGGRSGGVFGDVFK